LSTPDNLLQLTAQLSWKDQLRYTPAGIAVQDMRLQHQSRQFEAGAWREVRVELDARALDQLAHRLTNCELGKTLQCQGFLAPAGRQRYSWRLHITHIEFV